MPRRFAVRPARRVSASFLPRTPALADPPGSEGRRVGAEPHQGRRQQPARGLRRGRPVPAVARRLVAARSGCSRSAARTATPPSGSASACGRPAGGWSPSNTTPRAREGRGSQHPGGRALGHRPGGRPATRSRPSRSWRARSTSSSSTRGRRTTSGSSISCSRASTSGGVFVAHNVVNKAREMGDFLTTIRTHPGLLIGNRVAVGRRRSRCRSSGMRR